MAEEKELNTSVKKLKFDEVEYNLDDLPEEGKNLINGLKTVDIQLKMYGDTINLLNFSKNKMLQELKSILKDIKPTD
ncbi:DUF6447 family protein [Prochlorococcus sp. AH-716-M06]|nr:DUF6447 family protein [Prochlorococcus sp. AH-716-M06]|tara:strand:+ start:241 stop:471 length:231 start_codon:yes stop_codon:yes gene_type:complete